MAKNVFISYIGEEQKTYKTNLSFEDLRVMEEFKMTEAFLLSMDIPLDKVSFEAKWDTILKTHGLINSYAELDNKSFREIMKILRGEDTEDKKKIMMFLTLSLTFDMLSK